MVTKSLNDFCLNSINTRESICTVKDVQIVSASYLITTFLEDKLDWHTSSSTNPPQEEFCAQLIIFEHFKVIYKFITIKFLTRKNL